MPNFFFLSLHNDILIEHVKISVKFDNFSRGKARISFRATFILSEKSKDAELYLLIKNDESPVTIEKIASEYNKFLDATEFRQVAGAYAFQSPINYQHCTAFPLGKFLENRDLEDKMAIHPKTITCTAVRQSDFPDQLRNMLNERDILLRISVDDLTEILSEISTVREKPYIYTIQFRIFLGNFVHRETLKCWRSPGRFWSVDFDLHKERGHTPLFGNLMDRGILRYPRSVELWFTIPHSYYFVASMPPYEKAIRLKPNDIGYKTERKEVGEFETQEGDYAVKIMNRSGDFVEFSIICVSPFLPEEQPKILREEITEKYITWKEILIPLTLLVTLLSLIVSSTIVLALLQRESIVTPLAQANLELLILSSLLTGTLVCAVAFSLSFASRKYAQHLEPMQGREKYIFLHSRGLAWAIVLIWIVAHALTIIFIYLRYP